MLRHLECYFIDIMKKYITEWAKLLFVYQIGVNSIEKPLRKKLQVDYKKPVNLEVSPNDLNYTFSFIFKFHEIT